MKNIRSISTAALSVMLLFSATASQGMWKSIVNFAKAHPLATVITGTAIAAAGYVVYDAVTKMAKDKAILTKFEKTITSILNSIDDIRLGKIIKKQRQFSEELLTASENLKQLSKSQTNKDIKEAAKTLLLDISSFDAQNTWLQVFVDKINDASEAMKKYGFKFNKIARLEEAKQELAAQFEIVPNSETAADREVKVLESEFVTIENSKAEEVNNHQTKARPTITQKFMSFFYK
jgi:DNA repair ATPase RecN